MTSLQLADYIEAIYHRRHSTSHTSHRPFNNGAAQNPPILRRHGTNRILLFPGSFNPPHQGHLQLLRHVFENAGDDLHIVATIIVLSDDDRLKDKLDNEENAIIFTRAQRAGLWREAIAAQDWAWVYEHSESNWLNFREELVENLREGGLELKFILLGGPDSIGAQGRADPRYWNCTDSITSDVSRPVDFRYPNSMRQLSGCSMWEKPKVDRRRLERQVRAKLRGRSDTAIGESISRAFAKIEAVWVCHRLWKPKGMIRFVPCNLNTRPRDPPSSTTIRELISSSPEQDLRARLETLALSPDLLIKYIDQRLT